MTVGIVGAGITGLTLTHALRTADVPVRTFEAHSNPGGTVRSRQTDGHVIDLGPQRLRLTPGLEALVDELGLTAQLRAGDDDQPLYIYREGDLYEAPLSVTAALSTDLLSLRGKLRVLKEPLTAPVQPGETVDDFLTRKFGPEAARRFFGPLYSGLYGTDPAEMLMKYSLGRALANAGVDGSVLVWAARKLLAGRNPPPVYTFDNGLGTLSEALYSAHADHIELATPVTGLTRRAGGYELQTPTGPQTVDTVVLTVPAPTAGDLLDPVAPAAATQLQQLTYNPIGMVFLESSFDQPGMGTIVPSDADVPISGLTWNASFLDRDGLFTAYLDADSYPELATASDAELGTVAAGAFETLTGVSAHPIDTHRWEPGMPAYDGSWSGMNELSLPTGIHIAANYVGRPGLPGRVRNANALAETIAET